MNYIYCWKLCLVNVTHVSLCEMWRRPEPFLLSPCLFSQLQSDTLQDRHECLNDILLSWLMVGSTLHDGGLNAMTLTFFGLSLCP